jgi:hypothetical protein
MATYPDIITEPTVHLCWSNHAIRRAAEVLRAAGLDRMAADVEAHVDQVEELVTEWEQKVWVNGFHERRAALREFAAAVLAVKGAEG